MRNPQSFDPQAVGRYTVLRVSYQYAGSSPEEKLFVALKHQTELGSLFCWCVKATSQVDRFRSDSSLVDGCVKYLAGDLPFFDKETIIDPANFLPMLHETLGKAAARGGYRIEGKMPPDFHARLVKAIQQSITLEPKKRAKLLEAIGEKP